MSTPAPLTAVDRLVGAEVTRMGEMESFHRDGKPGVTVRVSFSSERPHVRIMEDGERVLEVLGHEDAEVDLSALNSGTAPLLKDHLATLDAQIGVVESAWVEGRRGVAIVRFSDTPAAKDVLARVHAGDVTGVSVGYRIVDGRPDGEADGIPIVRVTSWVPREISFVAIPADPTVGYGRSAAAAKGSIPFKKEGNMPDDITPGQAAGETTQLPPSTIALTTSAAAALTQADMDRARAEGAKDAMTRSVEIDAIAKRFDLPEDMVSRAKRDGVSLDAFRQSALDHIGSDEQALARAGAQRLGLTDTETRAFSFLKLVRHLANPTDKTALDAGFELEVTRAAADAKGGGTGLSVPADVLLDPSFATRAQSTATDAAGGALVATDHLAGSFIDVLRDRMILAQAGVTMLPGLTGNVDIPKQTGETQEYWVAEGGTVTDSQATFATVPMSPHTLGIATPITRRMILQSTPGIEALIRSDIVSRAALAIQKVALVGDASADAPDGLKDTLNAGAYTWTSANAPTFAEMVNLHTLVAAANADAGTMRFVYNAVLSGALQTTKVDEGSGIFVEQNGMVAGHGRLVVNQMGASEAFFGDWSKLVIGMWSGLDLEVDRAALASSGGIVLRAFQDVDVAVTQAAAFSMGRNV